MLLANALVAGAYVDIVVCVLHVLVSEHSRTRLVVWDGSSESARSQDTSTRNSLAARLEGDSIETPARGVLREVVFDSCWGLLQTFGFVPRLRSHWCRFRNLHVADDSDTNSVFGSHTASSGDLVLRFREGSSIMFLPDNVQDVQDRVQLSARNATTASPQATNGAPATDSTQQQHLQPQQPASNGCVVAPEQQELLPATPTKTTTSPAVRTIVPEFIRTNVPVTPLRDVQRSAVVPRKFYCVARFVRMWPSDVAKLTKRQPSAASSSSSSSSETFVYSFVLRLKDATGAIDAIVYGKDAVRSARLCVSMSAIALELPLLLATDRRTRWCLQEYFLQGIPPCDLLTSSSSRAVLEKKLTALLSSQQLLQCCIKSYYPPSAKQGAASVRYRLFDTLLQ